MIFQVSNAFKIKTPQGVVGLEPGEVVDFPPEKAESLVNAGKIIPFRKSGPLPENVPAKAFEDTFKEAMNDLEERYLPGALDYIREDFPDLAQEIQEAEARINQLWLIAQATGGDRGQFKEAVERWKALHLRGVRFYSIMKTCQ
jgi:hypothetical protein